MVRKYKKSLALCFKASALLVSLSSGYGRAIAGSCTGGGGTYLCGGGAAPGDGTQNLFGNPLMVTTSSGFGIDSGSGDAFSLYSSNGLVFVDGNTSVITGSQDGIVAVNNAGGSLSITTNGSITGTSGIGIWADNHINGTNLTITAANVAGGDDGINAINSGTGHLWITTTGHVEGNFDNGIYTRNSSSGTELTLSTNQVTGGNNGIVATNNGSSSLSITAADTVTGTSGIGLWANNSANGANVTLVAADVTGGNHGISATNNGAGRLSITSNGSVLGTTGFGIYANNSANGTNLTISSAEVTGGYVGIVAFNHGSGPLSITTSGPTIGTTGYGMYANNSSNGNNLTITAAGAAGGRFGIQALNSGDGSLAISASDTVTGTSTAGISANNSSAGIGLTIAATIVSGGTEGINATNLGSGALSITTTGAVTGTNTDGILANNSLNGTDLTLATADVSGGNRGIFAVNYGSGTLSITSSGTVASGAAGIGMQAMNFGTDLTISAAQDVTGGVGIVALNQGSGALSITAGGTVDGSFGPGIHAINGVAGTDLTIAAQEVTGGVYGILAINTGRGALSITTTDAVIGGDVGIIGQNFNLGTDLTIAAADVSGAIDGIIAQNAGSGALSITTSGMVTGTGDFGIFALNDGGRAATIDIGLQSMVEGASAGIFVQSSTGQAATINVFGQVGNLSGLDTDDAIIALGAPTTVNLFAGSITTGIVSLGHLSDTLTLAGTLNGSVFLNDGNDTFTQVGGATLTGIADGGNGSDTLGFNNMGSVNGSQYLNFENLGIFGGSTTLTGTWDFSGGTTTIHQGDLNINGTLATSLLTVADGGQLVDNGTLTSGALHILPGGTADVNGTATITGDTTVGGLLNVNSAGILTAGTLTVEHGGILGGNGSISGNVIDYGTISPGHSIGTLSVNGSLSFMPGSTYIAELAANGNSDLIQINGPVSIAGGTVATALPVALYADGRSWRIITATDGILGKFSAIDSNFTSHTVDLKQRIDGDSLSLVIVRTPYATFGDTANQEATGSALDALLPTAKGTMADLLINMDFAMNPSQLTDTLQGLNPEMYTSYAPVGLKVAGIFGDAAALRQQEIDIAAAFPNVDGEQGRLWNVWGRVLGNSFDRDADEGFSGYSVDTGGTVFGFDRAFGSTMHAGLLLGYSDSDLSWDDADSSGGITGKYVGIYGGAGYAGFKLDGSAGYTSLDNGAARMISSPAVAGSTASSFDSGIWGGMLSLGYDFRFADLLLGPVATVEYLHLNQDGFSEDGAGDFDIRMDDGSLESLTSSFGVRLSGLYEIAAWRILPHANLSLRHQFEDEAMQLTANFVDYSAATFTVSGADPVANETLASLGMSVEYGANFSLYLDYQASLADEEDSQLISGGLSWRF